MGRWINEAKVMLETFPMQKDERYVLGVAYDVWDKLIAELPGGDEPTHHISLFGHDVYRRLEIPDGFMYVLKLMPLREEIDQRLKMHRYEQILEMIAATSFPEDMPEIARRTLAGTI